MKKKVGIMSMQRIINYGSFLQAFALSHIVKNLGHEVEFVDFKIEPCIIEKENKLSFTQKLAKFLEKHKSLMNISVFKKFVTKHLNISKVYSILLFILTILCYFISREVIEKEMKVGKSSEKMKEKMKEQLEKKNEKNGKTK